MLQPIGKILVPLNGTPVQVTSLQPRPADNYPCHGVLIQALPSNSGKVYIGKSTLNKNTLADCFAVLAVPTTNQIPSFTAALTLAPNAINLTEIWIDVDVNGEGALVSVLVA